MIALKEPTDQRIRTVVELAIENPNYRIGQLAGMVNMSPSRLHHLFKQETGARLGEYVHDLKLKKAASLLELTDLSVKEVTHRIGYHHSASFVRAFKERFALTPQRFRKIVCHLVK